MAYQDDPMMEMSCGQKALWYLNRLEPASTAYHLSLCLKLEGRIDEAALTGAWQAVCMAHPQLRARFTIHHDEPFAILDPLVSPLKFESDGRKSIDDVFTKIVKRPFNLEEENPVRCLLHRSKGGTAHLVACLHHIAGDLFSCAAVLHELSQSYAALASGEAPPLRKEGAEFESFVTGERRWLNSAEGVAAWNFWSEYLKGARTEPLRRSSGARKEPGEIAIGLDSAASELVCTVARQRRLTPYEVLLACYAQWLGQRTGTDEFTIGTPASLRDRRSLRRTVGYLVNTVPIRCRPLGSNIDRLDSVSESPRTALKHRRFPFSVLVERMRVPRRSRTASLIQATFAYYSLPAASQVFLPFALGVPGAHWEFGAGVKAEAMSLPPADSQFPLALTLGQHAGSFTGTIQYDGSQYNRDDALSLVRDFPACVEELFADRKSVATAPVLFPSAPRLEELFENAARRTPDAIVANERGLELTYSQMKERAEVFARGLDSLLEGDDRPVALQLESGVDATVAILAILKCGRAFVPVDSGESPLRRHAMLAKTGACALLSKSKANPACLPGKVKFLDFDSVQTTHSGRVRSRPRSPIAYIIFTSGTTGEPKAVEVGHDAILNHARAASQLFGLVPEDHVLQFHMLAFDAAFEELFPTWAAGARNVFEPNARKLSIPALLELVDSKGITVLNLPTSYWHMLTEEAARLRWRAAPNLRLLVVGGETASAKAYASWRQLAPHCRWINTYGPTETTITALAYEPPGSAVFHSGIPIGRPIAGVEAYVFNHAGDFLRSGEGELFIGGVGLALGYRGDANGASAKFVIQPASGQMRRLYRTGDRVKLRDDGVFEYLGRLDRQLKIRGYRVDPEEIEQALRQHEGVADAAVFPVSGENDLLLGASIVRADPFLTARGLREYLSARIPGYMIPSRFKFVPRLPRKSNGKLDARAVIRIANGRTRDSATLREVTGLFSELLGAKTGPNDDFFLHGGHSLMAIKLLSRVETRFGARIPIADFVSAPTPQGLLGTLQTRMHTSEIVAPRAFPSETPVSAEQRRALIGHEIGKAALANISLLARIYGPIDPTKLEQAWNTIVRDNPILRCGFNRSGNGIVICETRKAPAVEYYKVSGLNSAHASAALAKEQAAKAFSIDGESPWIRLLFIRAPKRQHDCVVLITHHAVLDGWAAGLLLEDLRDACDRLPKKPRTDRLDYRVYASAQPDWLEEAQAKAQAAYWHQQLAGAGEIHLPFQRPATDKMSWQVARRRIALPQAVSRNLRRTAKSCGVSAFAFSMAAFKALLFRYGGQTDITLGTMVSNRTDSSHAGILGPLQNPVLIRNQFNPHISFRALAKSVAHSILSAEQNGLLPFEKAIHAAEQRNPRLNSPVQFLSHETAIQNLRLGGARLKPIELLADESPFALAVAVTTGGPRIRFTFEFQTAAFSLGGMKRLAQQFSTLLIAALAHPDLPITKLPMCTKAERLRFRRRVRKSLRPVSEFLHKGFEARARSNPNALALIAEDTKFTYRELDDASGAVAAELRAKKLRPGGFVAVMLPKSCSQVLACLGSLKAGGVYVPIDPSLPQARLDAIFNQGSFHSGVIADQRSEAYLHSKGVGVVTMKAPGTAWAADVSKTAPARTDLSAYVIFTSGTTGMPKGVVTSHDSAMTTIAEINRRFGLSPKDRVLAVSDLGFDLSVFDIFGTLRAGGTIVLPAGRDPKTWADQLAKDGITVWNSVPCLFELLMDEIESRPLHSNHLRLVLLSGDFIPLPLARRARAAFPQARLVSLGGATEASIWSIAREIKEVSPDWRSVPYGRPLRNQEIFVLDNHLEHCAPGVSGELFIAGAGLAQGYWRNPAETRRRFLIHPRWKIRLYRTGDRGRYSEDGEIEILGRIDAQRKINGIRVELGEVEALVGALPGVRQAIAHLRTDSNGNHRLVAFVTAEAGTEVSHLFSRAKETIPSFLLPTSYKILDQFPLTANGKIDRPALARIAAPMPEASTTPPQTSDEQWIAALWSELLGVESVGVDDDFFALGGHSLLAIRMLQRVRSHFGVQLPIATILRAPTVGALATAVKYDAIITPQPVLARRRLAEFGSDLDPRISNCAPARTPLPPGVLLTGATGHLGSALLLELLRTTKDTVHCLVRSSTTSEAMMRITQALRFHKLGGIPLERIIPVPADLTRERFGLGPSAFGNLTTQIHSIYHCAAEVNFISPYEKLAAVNVEAVRAMAQLAARSGATLHHISSVAVFPYGGRLVHREDEDISTIEVLTGGYAQSKWVAERIIARAMSQGLRAVIYRPAQIAPRLRDDAPRDLFQHLIRTCQILRAIPDIDTTIDIVTPEFAASAVRVISTKPSSFGKVFHLVHPQPLGLRDVASWISLPVVPFGVWQRLLDRHAATGDDPSVQFVSILAHGLDRNDVTPPEFDCSRTTATLLESGMACPPIEPCHLANFVGNFVECSGSAGFQPAGCSGILPEV